MISAAARIATILAVAAAATAFANPVATALADPVDKAHLRTSPKSSQASPGLYFDPASGQFRQKPPSAESIVRYSERTARRGGEGESGEGGGPLSSSEETHLSAVLPLVRFTRKKEGRSEGEAGGGGGESEGGTRSGGGDILKVKRKKKLKSSVAQETIRSRPSRVKLKRKGGNGGKSKSRVRQKEGDFEGDDEGGTGSADGGDGDNPFFGEYGSESRTHLRNAPGRQFGAASTR